MTWDDSFLLDCQYFIWAMNKQHKISDMDRLDYRPSVKKTFWSR